MNHARSHGFTLLEVLLALGLTGLILVALGMAIDFHFRVLDAGRAHVEEAQLARVLLRRIADDVRAAVHAAVSAEDTSSENSDSTDSTDSTETTDPTETAVVHTTPGIYGDAYSIQIDVSRLPQPHQLQTLLSSVPGSEEAVSLSDVKTVTYFAAGSQSTVVSQLPLTSAPERGLMRCEMDRAVAAYQAEQGGLSPADLNAVLLAPEVAGLEFAYFDGTQWVDLWDTQQNNGLPVAVRIILYVTPRQTKRRGSQPQGFGGLTGQSSTQEGNLAYSLLVNIPAAQPTKTAGTSETTESSAESKAGEGETKQ